MELFRLLGTIAVDNADANRNIDETAERAESASNNTQSAFGRIGSAAGTMAKTIGAGAVAIGGAIYANVESTREYRVAMGKLDTAFVTSGLTSQNAKNTYSELNAVLGDSDVAVEASAHLAKLCDNQEQLTTWTDICTGVYATFGDSLPIEGLTEAANETAKTGSLTGSLADALNWAGVSEDDFQASLDKCTSEQERQSLITDTLNGLYSDASKQYKETNKDVIASEKAQQRLTDAMAEMGAAGEPAVTAVKNAIADLAVKAVPVISALIEGISDMLTWIQENESTIKAWTAAIIGASVAIAAFLIYFKWSAIMTAASTALTTLKTAVLGVNAAMAANPVGIIIALIAGLVAAFIYLWNTSDTFRNFWLNLWDNIKEYTVVIFEAIKSAISTAIEAIKTVIMFVFNAIKTYYVTMFNIYKTIFTTAFNVIKTVVTTVINAIKTAITFVFNAIKIYFTTIFNIYKTIFTTAFNIIKTVVTTVVNAIKTTITTVFNAIKSFFTTVFNAIQSIVSTAFNTIKSTITTVINTIKSTISTVFNAIKSTISTIFDAVSSKVTTVFNTIKSTISSALNSAKSTVTTIMNNIKSAFSTAIEGAKNIVKTGIDKIKSFFNFDWKLPELKLPHFKIKGSFGIDPPSVPSFGVDWYAKAMKNGTILNDATIFGMNSNGTLLGAGEAGSETIVGTSSLMTMIQNAVNNSNSNTLNEMITVLTEIKNALNSEGDIIIPVSIGNEHIDEIVINAKKHVVRRSGGRAYA